MNAVNLLPPELRRIDRDRPSAPTPGRIVLGALAVVLAGAALHTTLANEIDRLRRDVASTEQRAQARQVEAAALAPARTFAQQAEERKALVRRLAKDRFAWDATMRDVARVLPAQARLTALDASVAPGSGAGGSAVRTALPVPAIVVKGCIAEQRQVPALLSRLADVEGATRAVLGSSERPDSGADGPCAAGRAPTFEVTVFFDASAGGGPSPAGATAEATATGSDPS